MDFLNFIIQNGCSLVCYYDDEKYPNRVGLQLFTPANQDLQPEHLDNEVCLLLTLLVVHISKYVNDPFSYNSYNNYGKILINNKTYDVYLPQELHETFKNNSGLDNQSIHNKINYYVLNNLNTIQHHNLYHKLKSMFNVNHLIQNVSNEGERKTVGVGLVFSNVY